MRELPASYIFRNMEKPPTNKNSMPEKELASDALLSGSPPSLTLSPRPPDESAANPPLTASAVRALAASACLPPPRRRLLEGLALLWHDHWDLAHEVAQSHEGQSDYDLLHAMGHRREGDYPNAEYWFRSAGRHPCHARLEIAVAALLTPDNPLRKALLPEGRWSSKAFVTEVHRHSGATGLSEQAGGEPGILIRVQALEFRAFSDWLLSS